ncbi:hypothetical protein LUZ60_006455 [Juncus effusus]|nr:hypothetical protein LUZ60_006455 [Juncus effusus]
MANYELKDIDDLPKNDANYTALTPLWFLERAALVHPNRASVIHGPIRFTWADTYRRCRQLASALSRRSIGPGCTVAVLAPNIPAMYEAHFGVPMCGAVINCINTRLNPQTISFLLQHSRAHALLVDHSLLPLALSSLKLTNLNPLLIVISDPTLDPIPLKAGSIEYEKFLEGGDVSFEWVVPKDEWASISLGYTSGTTSSPKGVVLHHRGAYLMALSGALVWGMGEGPVYLWTLPMFHCNGWCYAWTLAALCGTSVCLRQVTAKSIFSAISTQGVTHFCGAPVVLNTIINAPPSDTSPLPRTVQVMTAGAAPPPSVLSAMSRLGFRVTHTYGLSETYGPSTVCVWKPEWDGLDEDERAKHHGGPGIPYIGLEGLDVVDPKSMKPVPADGVTLGEIVMRGNGVMKGYLKNPEANAEAFKNGWFHSGDLGVKHTDGYIEVKDRAKDIIISGGENISSIEVEKAVYMHPAVLEASVVAREDERWGESPCAFVTLKEGVFRGDVSEVELKEDIMRFCKERLPGYWVPKSVVFGALPKTATGKIKKHELRAKAKELGPVKKSRL